MTRDTGSSPSSAPQIAILGGSFDPPHFGHVFLAAYALGVEDIERVLVLPVHQHAFGKALTPFEHRLKMCELAFRDLRRVEVSALERELGGVSRTLRLIEAVEARYPRHRLRTLVGTDILGESERWQGFDEITRRAPLLVGVRGGHEAKGASTIGPTLPEISATELRAAFARGELPSDRMPSAVAHYAAQHALYVAGAPP